MKFNKILFFIYAALLIFGTSSFFLFPNKKNIHPKPTEILNENDDEHQQGRLDWIEEMHKTLPGTGWRAIEHQNRWRRYKSEKQLRTTAFSDTIANGTLVGQWREKGSRNQCGRICVAEFDSVNNKIYCGSDGGIVWKGNMNGTNWIPLNDKLKFDRINMIRIISHGASQRILVGTGGIPFFYTSDDNGHSWNPATGLAQIAGFGQMFRSVVIDDALRTIYLLASQYDSLTHQAQIVIYRSKDHGNSFAQITTFVQSLSGGIDSFDLWAPRYGNISAYLINNDGVHLNLYKLDSISGFPQLISQNPPASMCYHLNLTGFNSSPVTLYAFSDPYVYRSGDGGMTWQYMSTQSTFDLSRNNFQCSISDPNTLFVGGTDAFRSVDSGATWTRLNTWQQYYAHPDSMLHADIDCIIPFLDGTEKQFIGTDGGLYVSSDMMQTVSNVSLSGLYTSQYYDTYSHQTDTNFIFAGTQDQGVQRCQFNSGIPNFDQLISGDYGHIVSSNGGDDLWMVYPGMVNYVSNAKTNQNWFDAYWQLLGLNQLWMPPLMADPLGDPKVCYMAARGLLVFNSSHIIRMEESGGAINRSEMSYNFMSASGGGYLTAIASHENDPSQWYALTDNGKCFFSYDTGLTWTPSIMSSLPGPQSFYGSAIYIMRTQPGVVFVGGSGYNNPPVYVSTDHGNTFTPANNGLPSTLVYDFAADQYERYIFAATESGPYVYVRAQNQWYPMSTQNSPDQIYWSVEYLNQTNIVRFGTYGRGIWDFRIESIINTSVEKTDEMNLTIYPNPSSGKIFISSDATINEIRIFDETGKLIYSDKKGSRIVDISGNMKGLNFVEITCGENKIIRKVILY